MARRFPYSFPYYPVTEGRFQTSIANLQSQIDVITSSADLDFVGDAGGAQSVILGSQTFTIAGDTGVATTGSAQTITIAVDTLYTADYDFSDQTRDIGITGTTQNYKSTLALNTALAGAGLSSMDGGVVIVNEETADAYDDVCGFILDPDNYQTALIAYSTGQTIGASIEAYADLVRLHSFDATGSFEVAIDAGGNCTINDQRATAAGFEYSADYSATFTARSLVDKGYVDAQVATVDTWDEVMHLGATFTVADTENLSATITQNDVTNNPAALIIANTGSGNDITAPNFSLINGVATATTVNATTFDTNVAAAGVTLVGTTLAADGSDADISITVTPKGTGTVVLNGGISGSAFIDDDTMATASATTVASSESIKAYSDNTRVLQTVATAAAATYDLGTNVGIVNVTYTGTGAVTSLTLMSAEAVSGRIVHIKDAGLNANTNNITIDTEGAETIDGNATEVISTDGGYRTLYCDGSNWFIIGSA